MLSITAERTNASKQTKSIPDYIVPHREELEKFLYVVSCEVQQKKDSIHFERVKCPWEKLPLTKIFNSHHILCLLSWLEFLPLAAIQWSSAAAAVQGLNVLGDTYSHFSLLNTHMPHLESSVNIPEM